MKKKNLKKMWVDNARKQQIPMTNYGVAIAHLNGILDKIAY